MVQAPSFAKTVGLGALLLVTAPSMALGQPVTITGRVVEAASLEPIVAATVEIQGDTTSVAVTDSAGRYSIAIPRPEVTLVFAAPGFTQVEICPAGRAVINVPLSPRPLPPQVIMTGCSDQIRPIISARIDGTNAVPLGVLPCDGAALPGSSALDPQTPPRRMPDSSQPPAPIPNACAAPTPGSAGAR